MIIDDIKQFIDTFNYICDNPVKADMVKEAKDYRYGGFYYILKGIFDTVDRPDLEFFKIVEKILLILSIKYNIKY